MNPRKRTKWRFVNVKQLTGLIAKWGVVLSPYECPANLVDAVRALNHRAHDLLARRRTFERFRFTKMTEHQIKQVVGALVFGTPELRCWNRCRRGKTPLVIGVSAFDGKKKNPDSDIIDLHALVLNVMRDFRAEWAKEDCESQESRSSAQTWLPMPQICPVAPPQTSGKRFLKKVLALSDVAE